MGARETKRRELSPFFQERITNSTKLYSVAGVPALGRARGDVRLLPNAVVLVRDLVLVLGPAHGLAAGTARRWNLSPVH